MPEALQTTLPDQEVQQEPESRRDYLEAAFADAEKVQAEPVEQTAEQRARDEAGRFAAKEQATDVQPKAEVPQAEIPAAPPPKARELNTWRKEFRPLHQKLERGEALTPDEAKKLAEYNYQRESEYATGVSVHKDRADRLGHIEKAIEPYMPLLQQYNIQPEVLTGQLFRAHQTLALGSPEQKLQMFQKLAQDYGIPLGAVQQQASGQQIDPAMMQMIEQFNQLRGQVQNVTTWHEQQEQQRVASAISELSGDAEKYPHFEKVKGTMAQLLESGFAPDLKTAYAKAIRMDDEVWGEEQARQSQSASASNTQRQVIARAKASAISPKSSTPSGSMGSTDPKDRRALLAAAMDESAGRV